MNGKRTISTALLSLLLAWPQGPFCLCCTQAFGPPEAVGTENVDSARNGCCHPTTFIAPTHTGCPDTGCPDTGCPNTGCPNTGCPECECDDDATNLLYMPVRASQSLASMTGLSYRYDPACTERRGPDRREAVPHVPGHQQRQATLAVWLK